MSNTKYEVKKPKSQWQGILATPIILSTDHSALQPSAEAVEAFGSQADQRLKALFDHYRITSPDQICELAFHLAREAGIPGFEIVSAGSRRKGVGQPLRWRHVEGFELYGRVRKIIRNEQKSARAAVLACHDRFPAYKRVAPESLYARYGEFRRYVGAEVCEDLDQILDSPSEHPDGAITFISAIAPDGTPMMLHEKMRKWWVATCQEVSRRTDII